MDTTLGKKKPVLLENYKIMIIVSAIVQATYLFMFLKWELPILTGYAILALVAHIIIFILISNPENLNICLVALFAEIVIMCSLCNIYLGWGFGFSVYGVLLIPICFYNSYLEKYIWKPLANSILFVVSDAVFLIVSTAMADFCRLETANAMLAMKISFIMNLFISILCVFLYSMRYFFILKQNEETLAQNNLQLNFLANYDSLTKLRNRNNIKEQFYEYENGDDEFCIMIGDIDDFKKINDSFGHDCGDLVLKTIADIIYKETMSIGTPVRWGGEEFLIIIGAGIAEALVVAEKIRTAIEKCEISYDGSTIKATMTIGMAHRAEAENCRKMIKIADNRLYIGKDSGKNCITYQ